MRVAFAGQIVEVEDTTPWAPVNFKQLLTANSGNQVSASLAKEVPLSNADSSAINLEIRPLETVDISLDVVVDRKNSAFSDFELRINGFLPGVDTKDPCAWWIRDESTKLTTGKYTIAVPKGLTNVTLSAQKVYMRKDDDPGFIWKRRSGEELDATGRLSFETISEPMALGLRVHDAAPLKIEEEHSGISLPADPSREAIQQETEKLRTAGKGGEYDLGNGRTLRIDTRNDDKQSFTVLWKETAGSDGYQLKVVPKYEEPTSADLAKIRMAPEVPVRAGVGRPTTGWVIVWEPS